MPRPFGKPHRGPATGFTLIEVIIVIVVVSILVSVALPSYQASMFKGRRADAKAGLMDAVNRQESFMLDRSSYAEDMAKLGYSVGSGDPAVSEEKHYELDVEPEDPNCPIENCYVLTATPIPGGAQADDEFCTSFSVRSTGVREATGSAGAECW